jgi:hypothetical protein
LRTPASAAAVPLPRFASAADATTQVAFGGGQAHRATDAAYNTHHQRPRGGLLAKPQTAFCASMSDAAPRPCEWSEHPLVRQEELRGTRAWAIYLG